MTIGVNVLKELKLVLIKKHTNIFLLDIQNISDYANSVYEEIKEITKNKEYAISWVNEATMSILAISNHFFEDGWTNTTYKKFAQKLNELYKSEKFTEWCFKDNNEDVVVKHNNDDTYSADISNCFYIQVLNDYGYFLQKVAKANQQMLLSRLDKDYANKSLKSALKLVKNTIDLFKY